MRKNQDIKKPSDNFEEKVIQVSRVSKKTKGGNKIGFSVLMVVGDKKGQVGVALGKAGDVSAAMKKGVKKARKKMIQVPMNGTTIPFSVQVKRGAGVVLLKPAPKGSGVIAGGPVRAVVEAAGIRDISSKILGSQNQASSVYATFEALRQIATLVKIKGLKLRSAAEIEAEEERKRAQIQAEAKSKSQAKTKNQHQPKPVAQESTATSETKPQTKSKPKVTHKPKTK